MKQKLLIDHINMYVKKFEHLGADKDPATLLVFTITSQLEQTLEKKSNDQKILVLALNGIQPLFSVPSFEPTTVVNKTLAIFLNLNSFLYTITSSFYNDIPAPTQALISILSKYRRQGLIPGIQAFKERCLIIDNQGLAKQSLSLLVNGLKRTVLADITLHRQQRLKNFLDTEDKQHGVSQFFGKQLVNQTKEVAIENLSNIANDEFSFIDQLEATLQKPILTYRDIYNLKRSSEIFKTNILQLPCIKEVTDYHWFINIIVNLLNKFVLLVESTKSKQLKKICTHWQTNWIDVAKTEVNDIDANIYLR